jgi:hypothetical protein
MDAARAVDAQNAPQRSLGNRRERGSPQRAHASSFAGGSTRADVVNSLYTRNSGQFPPLHLVVHSTCFGMTTRFVSLSCLCTALIACGQLLFAVRNRPTPPPDLVAPGVQLYRSLSVDLPQAAQVVFLPTGPNSTFEAANYYVALYALAPRALVMPAADANVFDRTTFVITGVNPPANIDDDPRLKDFHLVGIRQLGVRVYRRVH